MSDTSVSLLGKIAGYTEILAKDPQSTVFVSLCEAYRQLGMLDDALEIAQKGTRHLQGFSPGFVALGRIHAQQDDLAEAANAFEKALAIEKDSLPALKALARCRFRQGHLDKARELLLRAHQLNPADPIVNKMLASLSPAAVVASSSQVSDEKVTVAIPSTPPAETGEQSTESGADASPIPTATLADLYLKQGLFIEAARIYRDILRRDPANERARIMLADLEQRIAETAAPTPASEETAVAVSQEPPQPISAAPEPENEPVFAAPPADSLSTLDMYQRWLNAIEQRRAYVC